MNIFLTSLDAKLCAQDLCDLRLNKMILETGQMLCTAYRHYAKLRGWPSQFEGIYKSTHENHPCNVWLRKDLVNYIWLYDYLHYLAMEKYYRTNKWHLTYEKLKLPLIAYIPHYAAYSDTDKPVITFNCSNILPSTGDVHLDYKKCLIAKWNNDNREPKWTRRNAPSWVTVQFSTSSLARYSRATFLLNTESN